jgi:outer membrane protein assembly factor BamB
MPGFVRYLSMPLPVRLSIACVLAATSFAGPLQAQQAPAPGSSAASTGTWTTYKGNAQRNSSSAAKVTLPLNLTWRYTADNPPFAGSGSPLVVGPPALRRVIFSAGNAIIGIDANNGTQLWKVDTGGFVRAPLTLLEGGDGGDVVLAVTTSGRLRALRAADGTELWLTETRSPVSGVGPIVVTIGGKTRILVAVGAGRIIAFSREGVIDPDFEVKLGRTGASPASTPALSADSRTLFIAGLDKNLYAIDTENGSIVWTAALRGNAFYSPAIQGELIVIGAGNDLLGFYTSDGQVKWRVPLGATSLVSPAISSSGGPGNKGLVYTGTMRGQFSAFSPEDGAEVWKQDLEASVSSAPLVLSNMVLVGTRNGVLYALNPDTGAVLWRYRMHTERAAPAPVTNNTRPGNGRFPGQGNQGGPGGRGGTQQAAATEIRTYGISAAPAAVDGQIYLTADNTALYSLDVTPFDAEPPLASEPSVSVRDSEGKLVPQLLGGNRPVIVPGRAPVYFAVILSDPGSGVDADSIKVTLNGNALEAAQVYFQASSGTLTCVLADTDPNKTVTLADGVYNIAVVARDYRSNILTYKASFTVDKAVPPPSQRPQGGRGGRGGRGGNAGGPGAPGGGRGFQGGPGGAPTAPGMLIPGMPNLNGEPADTIDPADMPFNPFGGPPDAE